MASRWWRDLPMRGKGAALVAVPLLPLLVTVVLFVMSERRHLDDRQWVSHTLEVKAQLARCLTLAVDAETGVRGYLLAGEREWLAPYEHAFAESPEALARLGALVADNPAQTTRLTQLRTLYDTRLHYLQALLEEHQRGSGVERDRDIVLLQQSRGSMESLRSEIAEMDAAETARLAERVARADASQRRTVAIAAAGGLVGLAGGLFAAWLFATGVSRRLAVIGRQAARVARGDRVRGVETGAEGADEVGRLAAAIGEAGLLLQRRERELQARVSELAAVNQELEAFSYSVSHDLRAPLRHVSGFVSLLERSAGDSLPPDARGHLATIAAAAHRMGMLIDDLLAFSRAGRTPMRCAPVDLNALIRDAREELRTEIDGRRVDWVTPPLPAVSGDPSMLRLVMVNLLSNALKYTRGRDPAHIEIVSRRDGHETIVEVKDNGVGFDMQYAGKLFGVFQRLHRQDEFEGTGIGLASVRRIVTRHGGRTWAEGALDKGAVFSFSLPDPQEGAP